MHHLTEDRAFRERLQKFCGSVTDRLSLEPVAGGCIHQAARLRVGRESFFLKWNGAPHADNFCAECDGLAALGDTGTLRVPAAHDSGVHADTAWLLMEWVDLRPLSRAAAAALGECLAELHAQPRAEYGWRRDNFIGASVQLNTPDVDWQRFYRDQRLLPQLQRATAANLLGDQDFRAMEAVLQRMESYFPEGPPRPALLHGDLWAGNAAQDCAGNPVLFDPAVYLGDAEADLAMMDLFGGFPDAFWRAYHAGMPRRPGFDQRRALYQLYHVLNHVNLFGGGYVPQARRLLRSLSES